MISLKFLTEIVPNRDSKSSGSNPITVRLRSSAFNIKEAFQKVTIFWNASLNFQLAFVKVITALTLLREFPRHRRKF